MGKVLAVSQRKNSQFLSFLLAGEFCIEALMGTESIQRAKAPIMGCRWGMCGSELLGENLPSRPNVV